MRFFHFTAERFLKGIKREGLTRGKLLKSMSPLIIESGWQWITTNDSFDQSWAHGTGLLPYKRNEIRLTLEIPEDDKNLKPWSQVRFLVPEISKVLSCMGDPENWWLYHGQVTKERIIKIEKNNNEDGSKKTHSCRKN